MKKISFVFLSIGVAFLTLYALTAVLRQNSSRTVLAEDGTAPYTIIDIGTLGGTSSEAADINNAVQIVGSSTISPEKGLAAFLWQEGSMTPLTVSVSMTTHAFAINDLGQIAGTAISPTGEPADQWPVLWAGETFTKLATISDTQGTARAINNLGLIAGNTITESSNHLLLWQGDSLSATIPISGGVGWANGLNDAGQMVGHIDDTLGSSIAFLWQDGAFTNLGTLDGTSTSSKANDINDATQIVGSAAISNDLSSHAFLWEEGVMHDLGSLGDVFTATSKANGINNLGMIVGQAELEDEEHAVLWQEGQIIDLNEFLPVDSDWDVLLTAESINDEGWIAGTGLMDGNERAYLLRPLLPMAKIFLPIIRAPKATPPPEKDMANYLTGDGRLYEVQHSTGSQARHQTQFEDSRFFHTKGNEVKAEWEELWADDRVISRGTDTSPGNDLYYTLYRDDGPGSPVGSAWMPRYWEVGDIYKRNPYVVFYRKSDCKIEISGSQETWLRFEAYYPQYTFQSGITLNNVIKLAWLLTENGQPEENYFYAEGYGLVGWGSQSHGFSYISELHAPGARPDNTREVISCLGKLDQPLKYSRELNFGPLPLEYARLVK